ncbi:MAG TPA: anthranilate phosphoribosyltransferase [Acidobacteriota bacterium]|nr:anthranilate phosphoribosyltransferase [Acidobacteriota bacterium]
MIQELLKKVLAKGDLTRSEAQTAMNLIMDGKATSAQIAGLLIGLMQKGEATDEVAGFVDAMREHAVKIDIDDPHAVDGCGTGGDDSQTFNISTAAAIVTSAAGVTVAKHGNRSVSSRCGSADLLEATGGNIDPGPDRVAKAINEVGFGFLFAPRFHPAMKHAAATRRELGIRTVFNVLGPMTNPAGVKRQVIGVYDRTVMRLMIEVMKTTGSEHVIMAHSREGHDEFSMSSPTDYLELKDGRIAEHSVQPEDLGLKSYAPGSVAGGGSQTNLEILTRVLKGDAGPYRDAVLINAGAMIYVGGAAESIRDGLAAAAGAVDTGRAREVLEHWITHSNS